MYQQIINKNTHRFQAGSVIKRRTFCKLFRVKKIVHSGEFADVQRSNLALVGVQAEVNNILRHSGLVMRSRDYYSEFYIGDIKQTGNAVLNYQVKAEANKQCSDALEKAVIQRISSGAWGVYSKHAVPPLTALVKSEPSRTYKNKLKRVKRWKA